ncbi:MAG TPA: alpha-L-arabinofuranosidase C-terminal domain-containing protein [Candidatus Limiplasma sp.]|nr:alpha-L-arabinofuranosidase C-terminal domain-containing protein [Candidatus Limiplasma sp.]HRX09667.1 alpha-L-arabinofuranosidase C-terminal domain-containing protein [Candidatus Limiplasma sp.]
MKTASIHLHPRFQIGEISPRLYGAFLEPIGTMVNGSMYNPRHPTADANGFRQDFIQALKATGLPAVRLPGGNFVSGWDWKDSIGPRESRKTQLDTAWFQYYTNEIGHDEYLKWTQAIGAEPMYTVNLGTNDLRDALHLVEYTNRPSGSYWADLRKAYGQEEPYQVKTWYLGNEMDGPWQIGSWEKNAKGYGVLAHEVSKGMKWTDPGIETVACVSSSPFLAHYPQWDLEVLQECYETVDYISLHHYHIAAPGDYAALLGGSVFFEDYINTEIGLCDFVQTKLRSPRKMMLSFDEYGSRQQPLEGILPGRGTEWAHTFDPKQQYTRHDPDNMHSKTLFVPRGGMADALSSASALLALLRHADRVKIGCMTAGLQTLAATDRDHVWKPIAHYPFAQLMQYGRGISLQTVVDCDRYAIPGYAPSHQFQYRTHEDIDLIDAAAAFNPKTRELAVFVINRDPAQDCELAIAADSFESCRFLEHIQLHGEDFQAMNTYEHPDTVLPAVNTDAAFQNGKATAVVKSLSWNVFRFQAAGL